MLANDNKKATPKVETKSTPISVVPLIKRSGLTIVKKKKPKVEEKFNLPQKQTQVSSYGKMSAEVLEELAQKKKLSKAQVRQESRNKAQE